MLQSDDVMVPNMRVRKFQIDPLKFEKLAADEVFSDSDETEEESEEDDNDIHYDQVLTLGNLKLLLEKIIQVICFIFWTSLHSTEIHHQMK